MNLWRRYHLYGFYYVIWCDSASFALLSIPSSWQQHRWMSNVSPWALKHCCPLRSLSLSLSPSSWGTSPLQAENSLVFKRPRGPQGWDIIGRVTPPHFLSQVTLCLPHAQWSAFFFSPLFHSLSFTLYLSIPIPTFFPSLLLFLRPLPPKSLLSPLLSSWVSVSQDH